MSTFESLVKASNIITEHSRELQKLHDEFRPLVDEFFGPPIYLNTLPMNSRTAMKYTYRLEQCKVGEHWYCAPNIMRRRIK